MSTISEAQTVIKEHHKEGVVRTVKVTLQEADLSSGMAAMREWLDRNGYEVRRFNCKSKRR